MGCHPSHWLSYFSRRLKPPTSTKLLSTWPIWLGSTSNDGGCVGRSPSIWGTIIRYHQGRKHQLLDVFETSHMSFFWVFPWIFLQFSKMDGSVAAGNIMTYRRPHMRHTKLSDRNSEFPEIHDFLGYLGHVQEMWCCILVHFPIQPIHCTIHI